MQFSEVSYQRYPLPRLLQILQQGKLNMALILAKTLEREAALVYPAQPFVVVQPLLLVAYQHLCSGGNGRAAVALVPGA